MCNCTVCVCIAMTTQVLCFNCRNGKHHTGRKSNHKKHNKNK